MPSCFCLTFVLPLSFVCLLVTLFALSHKTALNIETYMLQLLGEERCYVGTKLQSFRNLQCLHLQETCDIIPL